MKLILDERERDLYAQCRSIIHTEGNTTSVQLIKQVLPIGDILLRTDEDKDVMLIERKSFADLMASIKDGRYEEQSYRLTYSSGFPPHTIVYLLEGMFSQLRSLTEKKTVYSAITSLNYFKGFSVMRTATVRESAEWLVWTANKIDRDFVKGKLPGYLTNPTLTPTETVREPVNESVENAIVDNAVNENVPDQTAPNYCTVVKKVKKDNITPENIGEIILCQIPGISSVTAVAIMKKFQSFPHFLDEMRKSTDVLENLVCENNGKSRKISKACVENIKKFLLSN
jgi:ERCC4-type nuclease